MAPGPKHEALRPPKGWRCTMAPVVGPPEPATRPVRSLEISASPSPASAIASFMRQKKESGGFEEGMLKLVRTLPKVLKYLPSD